MNFREALVAASLFVSAPACAQVDVGNMFKGYAAIETPQSDIPVGAIWIPGSGPSGPGADEANLRISKGASTSVVTKDLKQNLAFSLGTFLGLDANRAKHLKVELSNVEIHRVKDLTALKIESGQQVIVSAIKAGTISLIGDKSLSATIRASAVEKGISVSGGATSGDSTTLNLDGSGLFLAFQVVEFRNQGMPKIKTYVHGGKQITLNKIYAFDFCRCGPGDAIKIYVRNIAAPTPGGKFQTQTIESKDSANFWVESSLSRHMQGDTITAASAKIGYFRKCDVFATTKDGKGVCFENFPKSENYIQFTTSTMRLVPITDPRGSF